MKADGQEKTNHPEKLDRSYHAKLSKTALFLLSGLIVGTAFGQAANPRFSWDERTLAFQYCAPRCRVMIYSLDDNSSVLLDPRRDDMRIAYPSFDPSSSRIAYVLNHKRQDGYTDSQIVISHRDGSAPLVQTASDIFKRSPSFSFDGRKIIFEGVERIRSSKKGDTYGSADAYEYDLATRTERRLTDLRTVDISAPFFLPEGKHITFSTVGSASPRASGKAARTPLEKLFPNRTLFVLPVDGPHELIPFVTTTPTASNPMPLESGAIAFLSRVNEIDGMHCCVHDVFVATKSEVKCHTQTSSFVLQYSISRTGRYVAFVRTNPHRGFAEARVSLWDERTGIERKLDYAKPTVVSVRM